ncbi:MAG: hypothetical protein DMF60_00375 [Acidobacteria bacterium]|nr:MAG: hypothetical protein DMF60_00375 [Acidobacteriota bacterium]
MIHATGPSRVVMGLKALGRADVAPKTRQCPVRTEGFRIVAWSGADHSKYWTKANMVAYSNPQLIVRNELRPHTIERRDVLAGKFEA